MEFTVPQKLADGRYSVSTVGDAGLFTLRECFVTPGSDEWSVRVPDVKFIDDIDQQILDCAVQNSTAWFGREINRDTLAQYYQYSLENGALQVNLDTNARGKVTTTIFDQNKQVVTEVSPETQCAALVKLDGLWFLKRTFGPVWKVIQIRVKKQPQPVQCLIHDSDSDE